MKKIAFALLLASCAAMPTTESWRLDNGNSSISFVTTKVTDIAEVHTFRTFSGSLNQSGNVRIAIDLASVDTGIEIRDDRMRAMLFETDSFATATMTAKVDMAMVKRLMAGGSRSATIEGELALHGETMPLAIDVQVTRAGTSKLLVMSQKPVVVNAAQFKLAEGVERLREVAGLPSISKAVPVSFVLSFDAE